MTGPFFLELSAQPFRKQVPADVVQPNSLRRRPLPESAESVASGFSMHWTAKLYLGTSRCMYTAVSWNAKRVIPVCSRAYVTMMAVDLTEIFKSIAKDATAVSFGGQEAAEDRNFRLSMEEGL